MAAISDMTLLERWVDRRDPEAFAEIVRRHSAMVYATGLRVLHDHPEAEDVAQDCFIKLSQSAETVKSSLAGWLHTAATRRALDRIKSETRRRDREQAFTELQPEAADPTWSDIQTFVDEAIAELPDDVRGLVVRHFLEGETHDALAGELGVSRSTVTRRIQRGTDQVREHLERRGVAIAAGTLGASLLANSVQAAPASLTNALGKLALAGTGGGGAAVPAASGLTGLFTAKAIGFAATIAIVGGGAFWSLAPGFAGAKPTGPPAGAEASPPPRDTAPPEPAPAPEVLAAAVNAEESDADATRTVTGVVLSETGYPRKLVAFFETNPIDFIRDGDSGKGGRFTLADVTANETTLLARCQFTHKAAVVRLPRGETGPIDVILDRDIVTVKGRAVDASGKSVPKANVYFRVTSPDGDQLILGPAIAWRNGYYENSMIPAVPGTQIEARVSSPTLSTDDWGRPITLSLDPPLTTIPDIVLDEAIAHDIDANQELKGFYADRVTDAEQPVLGGIVQDENGKPIANAKVETYFHTESSQMMSSDTTYTAADGTWEVRAPDDLTRIDVRLECPGYVATTHPNQQVNPPLARLRDKTAVLTLKKGLRLAGRVSDESGAPVPDAVVNTGWLQSGLGDQVEEDTTIGRTDAEGQFEITTLPPQEVDVRVNHPDFAPAITEYDMAEDGATLDFVLTEGGTIRGRVVDEQGDPVPEARIHASEWALTRQHQAVVDFEINDTGHFTLRHIPEKGKITYMIGMEGRRNRGKYLGMSTQIMEPREEPYEIVMYEPPVFRGTVTDAETGEIIPSFRVRTLWHNDGQADLHPIGMSSDLEIEGGDGSFMKKVGGCIVSYPPVTKFAMKVYAEGYQPQTTPAIELGEKLDPFEIKLVKGTPWNGTVTDGSGAPVSDAQLSWIGPAEKAFVSMGRFQNGFVSEPENTAETADDGSFSLPDTGEEGYLLALHESGYGLTHSSSFERGSALELLPWARVEGKIYREDEGEENALIWMKPAEAEDGGEALPISWSFQDASHVDGRFEFDHVPALPFQVGRLAKAHQYGELSHGAFITPAPGQTHRVDIGTGGLTVKGRLDLAALTRRTGEAFDPQFVHAAAIPAGDGPEVHYVPRVEESGDFTIEALPPGKYDFEVTYHAPAPSRRCGAGITLARGAAQLEAAGAEGATIQAGVVALEPVEGPVAGGPAPGLAAFTFEGKEFQLADLRRRYVLLDFWATWCPPCIDAMEDVRAVREKYGDTKNLAVVGINFDRNTDAAKKFIERKGYGWTQLATDDWSLDNVVVNDFLIGSLPSLWLIDPEGNIVARDIAPEKLAEVVAALP